MRRYTDGVCQRRMAARGHLSWCRLAFLQISDPWENLEWSNVDAAINKHWTCRTNGSNNKHFHVKRGQAEQLVCGAHAALMYVYAWSAKPLQFETCLAFCFHSVFPLNLITWKSVLKIPHIPRHVNDATAPNNKQKWTPPTQVPRKSMRTFSNTIDINNTKVLRQCFIF